MDVRLVAITDRRRMVAPELLARNDEAAIAAAFGAAIAAVRADDVIVQVREKDLDDAALLVLVRAAIATGARVMVNDRVDVAVAAGAYGVHLPDRDLAIAAVRARAPGLAVGVSRHSIEGVRAAVGADLVQLGPIWETPDKGAPLGTPALAAARAAIAGAKLVAVGGIDSHERVEEARRAGADAVAAIRAVWSGRVR